MADYADVLKPGGPEGLARPLDRSRTRLRRRLYTDRLARRLVTLGGVGIIASILAILVVIAIQVQPLFEPPRARLVATSSPLPIGPGGVPLVIGVDEYREVVFVVMPQSFIFSRTDETSATETLDLPLQESAVITGPSAVTRESLALGLSDGRILPADVRFSVSYPDGTRRVDAELLPGEPIVADPDGGPIRHVAHAMTPGGSIVVAATGARDLAIIRTRERRALIGPSTRERSSRTLALPADDEITALALDSRGEDAFVGTARGQLVRVSLRKPDEPRIVERRAATSRPEATVSRLGFLIGDRTLIVGDGAGGVSSWQLLRGDDDRLRLRQIQEFESHSGAVVAIAPSRRDKGFLTADGGGTIRLHHGTTGKTLLSLAAPAGGLAALTFAPKADGLLAVDADGRVSHWQLDNPHPEITWRSLFGKVWYEGYAEPAHVWQSTGGTDDFEPKLSLTPLIYGTLKGTFYAMLFAIPLALFGALYASQFMHPTLKAYVKPTVEIMAALPSVVLGFIAGLWLAPVVERHVPALFLTPVVLTLLILLAVGGWRLAPLRLREWLRPGAEVFLLVPVVLVGGWLSLRLGGLVEAALLQGDYRSWLLETLGLTYDQRNSLVVGFAMGFAVIPIIFTIAEDSLSNVPQHLTAGSLALGATRWQTALRIVMPTASPGIFSAIMIGFGRAVGETMIVLMATGNTPVMDWSIFNGFRALSANIAVELPEAPDGATLFRVLFLAAFLLFAMTFTVNTVAELIRLRLRQRYRYL